MNVLRPRNLDDALELLAERATGSPAIPIAGGTDLLVHWPVRPEAHDQEYLDLQGLSALRGVRWTEDALELGALASYWDVIADRRAGAEFPLIADAARQIGAIQIQSRGT